MKKYILLAFLFVSLIAGRNFAQQLRMLPEVTPAGKGKVNTKIDNIGYWYRMVEMGYVTPNPWHPQRNAAFTGSMIHIPGMHPQDSPDIPVTDKTDVTQSENSVFIDPANEEAVLNSNNSTSWRLGSAQDSYGADALYSFDGGQGWEGSTLGINGDNNGDPSTAIGLNGWWYMGRINEDYGQAVSYSKDQGKTWTKVKVANGPSSGNGLLDKNHLWIDNATVSPFNGNVYAAWTNFLPGSADENQIEIVRSTDHGLTWSSPLNISTAAVALELNHGVNIHTGPNGEVYLAWSIYDSWPSDETAIGFTKSITGGDVFIPAVRIINNIKGIRASMTGKAMRVNSFPSMAVDNSTGPNRGNIYVVWSNVGFPGINTGSDIDVYLIRSTDGGGTWSVPIRVNQDPAGLGKQHFFPWITCDPVTGGLCVIYYDDRNLPSTDASVFVSWSYDGGLSWADMQVSDYTFTPEEIPGLAFSYFGDYIGIQSRNMKVFPVWTDNHDGGRAMTFTSPFDLGPNPNQPWVTYYSSTLSPVPGGGSVAMNYGDSLYLSLGLKNEGDQQAVDVNAYISADSPYVMITDSSAAYGAIDSAQVKIIQNGFTIKVSDTIPDNLLVQFNVRVTGVDSTWYSRFSIESHAPAMKINGISIVDTLAGNNNGRLDPGETVQLVVSNTNTGDFSCRSVYALLSSTSPYLTFLSDSVYVDSLGPGEVKNAVFTAIISADAPTGSGADLYYSIHSGLYRSQRSFRQMIGILIENWESNTFTKFPWQSGGLVPWTITAQNPWEGIYSARSGNIPDSKNSQLILSYASATDDSISFYLRTSSEEGCDWLLFYIDGVLLGQWSGITPWTRVAFPVGTGQHLFKWIYQKDLSMFSGEDRAMVDFIVLPPPILPAVDPGPDDTICAGMMAMLQATVQQCDSLKWSTTGDGVFGNDTLPATSYTPGTNDIFAGIVTCKLTGYGRYGSTGKNKLVHINPLPVAKISVFPHDTVCAGQAVILLADTARISTWLWTPGNLNTPEVIYDTAIAAGMGTHMIRLVVTDRFQCQNRDSVYLTFKDCTGIEENKASAILIYPNPGSGLFMIQVNNTEPGSIHLTIKNAVSEIVYDENDPFITEHQPKKINLKFLPDGVYLLTLTTAHGTTFHKLIIRK